MKNSLKLGFLAFSVAISVSACKGNNSSEPADTMRADSSAVKTNSATDTSKARVPGDNGAPGAVDSGMDKSGSGGTDTTQKNH
jgi:hypothetical protein